MELVISKFTEGVVELKPDNKNDSSITIPKNILDRNNPARIFGLPRQAEYFKQQQPICYDKAGLWWMWDSNLTCWIKCDEVDILNMITEATGADVVTSKSRSEILNSLKQEGRKNLPKPKPKQWIQFKDTLVDIKTGEKYPATPEYFLTNPIPHKLGLKKDTPVIDEIFKEWVVKEGVQDESYVKTLKEVTAYAMSEDLFMQRIIAETGGGLNGKGTHFNFIRRLVGSENCVSVEVRKLATSNFGMANIYKKLVAFAGEVSYNDLSNTNNLKKLSGEDLIEYEFKNKNSFSDESITTFFVGTNSLPITPDKSVGFYRRWIIIDFPNQFEIKPDILSSIPEEEYENFCLQCIDILKDLYETRKFTNEGNLEERETKYEDRSNPLPRFISEKCTEIEDKRISLQEFTKEYNLWCKKHKLRIVNVRQCANMLRTAGYIVSSRKQNKSESSVVSIVNMEWKTS